MAILDLVQDTPPNPYTRDSLTIDRLGTWRDMVTLMAEIIAVPVGLVMRVDGPRIEVFLASETEGNPYQEEHGESYQDSGLYCEWVVRNEEPLLVPNALVDPDWDQNPDIKLGLPSYMGLPLKRPDGLVFGTLCVLDSKENAYSDKDRSLMERFRDVIEKDMALIEAHQRIHDQEQDLGILRRVVPICMYCKSVRNDEGFWKRVEEILQGYSGKPASHGVCPDCEPRLVADLGAP